MLKILSFKWGEIMSYIESIKSYIEDLFGGNIEIRNFTDKDNLPNYLKNRLDFYEFKYYGVVFLIISYLYDEIVNISEIKNTLKQLRKYLDTNTKIVCIFNDLSNYTRKKLIEEKISFVVSGKQIYIPYLGIAYSNHISTRYEVNYSSRNNSIKKISPSAQALF